MCDCLKTAEWKREVIPDHKFSNIDITAYRDESPTRKLQYVGMFLATLNDILIYAADFGAVLLIIYSVRWNSILEGNFTIQNSSPNPLSSDIIIKPTLPMPQFVKLVIILTSVVASFVLLFLELRKASRIVASDDISFAFTSIPAYRFYAIRSYDHYCLCIIKLTLVSRIRDSRKTIDILALYVYFKFKKWKRLIFAELPRQFLNSLMLYDLSKAAYRKMIVSGVVPYPIKVIPRIYAGLGSKSPDTINTASFVIIAITFCFYLFKMAQLLLALLIYIPLVFQIRGNLKEYCVHKIDKR
jgi:hypothetical protein